MAGQPLGFRPLREADLPMLRGWLLRPHVAQWWSSPGSIAELRRDYLPGGDRAGATRAFVAVVDSTPVGFIQTYVVMGSGDGWWEGETDPGARGIDQFLADANLLGRGLGCSMTRTFVERLFEDTAVTVVQADPHPRNERAIRCYARAGFRRVGLVDTPDGSALLMRCTRETLERSA